MYYRSLISVTSNVLQRNPVAVSCILDTDQFYRWLYHADRLASHQARRQRGTDGPVLTGVASKRRTDLAAATAAAAQLA